MQEAPAAHKAFARILAIDDAVDVAEIGYLGLGAILRSVGRGRPVLAGIGERIGDALGRCRMR